jgi:hypothetical protein
LPRAGTAVAASGDAARVFSAPVMAVNPVGKFRGG